MQTFIKFILNQYEINEKKLTSYFIKYDLIEQNNLLILYFANITEIQSLNNLEHLIINDINKTYPHYQVIITIEQKQTETNNKPLDQLSNIKNIIMVYSGKGGVGKSTICKQLAKMYSKLGYKIGILDADFSGPSQSSLYNSHNQPISINKNEKIVPLNIEGIKILSMGFLLDEKQPASILKAPMTIKYLNYFLLNSQWGDLDILFIDMPPGISDIHIYLLNHIKNIQCLLVSTPHPLAISDTEKSIIFLTKLKVPILGIIENMSYFLCNNCTQQHNIFGPDDAVHNLASKYNTKLLCKIRISPLGDTLGKLTDITNDTLQIITPKLFTKF